jgi:thiol-disulfide isomerase/thioredoxin
MKGSVMMILVVCLYLKGDGQFKVDQSRAIKIGEYCPDLVLNVENFPTKQLQLSKLGKKLVIIDFWSTWCKSCILSFPKIDSMQREMKDDIQIILVTYQSKSTIDSFFKVRKKIKRPDVIMMTDDTLLLKLFPYYGLPHYVWLDTQRKVVAITDGYNMVRGSVQQFLKEGSIDLYEKKIGQRVRNDNSFLGSRDTGFIKNVKYFSYLMNAVDSLEGNRSSRVNGSKTNNRFFINRASINDLIYTAYRRTGGNAPVQRNIFYEISDISRYIEPRDYRIREEWKKKNLYLYDLLVPAERADDIYKIMMEDLERYFNLEIRMEKRKFQCWVLVETDSLKRYVTKGEKTNYSKMIGDSLRSMTNVPYWVLNNILEIMFDEAGKHFANSVEYTGNIDFIIHSDLKDGLDINMLRNDLRKYGLDVVEKEWLKEVLVVREKGK